MRKVAHFYRTNYLLYYNIYQLSQTVSSNKASISFKSRDQHLRQIRKVQQYDVIIIGGGCNGVGAYIDATTRGLKALLIEKDDFGSGTSSKSTKLFHGGVRYLEQVFQISKASFSSRMQKFQLVNEAIVERGLALKNNQYLSKKIPFLIPSTNWFWTLYYWIGSMLYYLIYKLKVPSNTPKFNMPQIIGKNKLKQIFPAISDQFSAAVIYEDGCFNDARLLIMTLLTAAQSKNVYNRDMKFFKKVQDNNFLNYAEIKGLLKNQIGKVNGVTFYDKIHKQQYKVKSKYVVNCTGVWSDKLRKMDDPNCKQMIIMVGGSHLTYDKKVGNSDFGLCFPSKDGRITLVVPWLDRVIVGTTEVTFKEPTNNPVIINQEKEFIRQAMDSIMNKIPVSEMRKLEISQWTGLRPLVLDPKNINNTKSISRDFVIEESESGMISLMGGKWTVFRYMGEKIIDRIVEKQNKKRQGNQKIGKSQTSQLKIIGCCPKQQKELFLSKYGTIGTYLFENYGSLAHQIVKGDMTVIYGNITRAQIQWICRNEMVYQVEDVLLRRTRIAFTQGKKIALQLVPQVARIIGQVNNLHESEISELVVRGVQDIQAYDF